MYTSLLVGLAALATPLAVHASTTFIKPPTDGPAGDYDTNPRYTDGKPIQIIFRTDLDKMNVVAVQDYPLQDNVHGGVSQTIAEGTQETTLTWTPNIKDWDTAGSKDDIVLYIAVLNPKDNSRDGASHYFNVTVPSSSSSSTTSSDSSSPTTSNSSSSASASSSSTDKPSSPSESGSSSAEQGNNDKDGDSSKSSGLSTGAKAGIAVGVTLAGLAALAGLGLLFWRRKKANRGGQHAEANVQELPTSDTGADGYYAPSGHAPSPQSPEAQMQQYKPYKQPDVVHEAP